MVLNKHLQREIYDLQKKAEQLDLIIPWLRDNLTGYQQKEIEVISDPLSLRILTYLASDEKDKSKIKKCSDKKQIFECDDFTVINNPKTIKIDKKPSPKFVKYPSKQELKFDVCSCRHDKFQHSSFDNLCTVCECPGFEFAAQMTWNELIRRKK